ncbi:MAG: HRDC domain-containing protein [Phycisphaerae bacterium]|nr:HRDC domain-containing protein [Phycisphaerae bacterium]
MQHPIPCHFVYVDKAHTLEKLTAAVKTSEKIALDTEADSLHSYYEKVCLIQLTLNNKHYILDPLADLDLTRFLNALANRPLIIHGSDYDLRMMFQSFNFQPKRHVFDSVVAARLLGYEKYSLAALTERFCNVLLPKTGQKSNWGRRPLTESQLIYACNDTRYMEVIAQHLYLELKNLNRVLWHQEQCTFITQEALKNKTIQDPENCWRLKGLSKFSRRQMAFVRQIWNWRERQAQKSDKPPFKVMNNNLILDLALWANKQNPPIDSNHHMPRLPRNCTGQRLNALIKAIKVVETMPENKYPDHKIKKPSQSPGPEFDTLRHETALIAKKINIPASILASRANLIAITIKKPTSMEGIFNAAPAIMRWQARLLEPAIKKIYS